MLKVLTKSHLVDVLKAVLYSLVVSIVCVLIYAICVKFIHISDVGIVIGNTVIKLVSLLVGCFFAFKNFEEGLIKGVLVGVLYAIVSQFVFSIISGDGLFSGITLWGILFSIIVGAISGIIAVNVRK